MSDEIETCIFKRTTFIVSDAARSAAFFRDVFGWTIWYDNELPVDRRFPPSGAPDQAPARLIILQARDPKLGKLGLLQYLEAPFDEGRPTGRTHVRMGEPILVIEAEEIDALYDRAVAAGATVVTPPVDWTVPGASAGQTIRLRTVSLFDPNGIYIEASAHPDRTTS